MDNSSSSSSNSNLKIKIDGNSSNCGDNSNKSIKLNGTEFNELFYRVWHNVVLRNQILKHRDLFKKYDWVYIKSHEELENHQFRDYISKLIFVAPTPIRIDLLQSLSSLTLLKLKEFNQPLLPGMIPQSVTDLQLWSYDYPLTKGCIPSSVNTLHIGQFNQPLPNDQCAIPDSVTILELKSFDQPLAPNCLPSSSITELGLQSLNQPLLPGSIPNSVCKLYLNEYKLPLPRYSIPKSVRTLHLYSNHSLMNLPSSVADLGLENFSPLKEDTIPESITRLEFFNKPSHQIEQGTLPSSIQLVIMEELTFKMDEDFEYATDFSYNPIFYEDSEDDSENNSE